MERSLRAWTGIGGLFLVFVLAFLNGLNLVHVDLPLVALGLLCCAFIVWMPEAAERRAAALALFTLGLLVAIFAIGWGARGWGPDALAAGWNAGDLALPLLVLGTAVSITGALFAVRCLAERMVPPWETAVFYTPLALGSLVAIAFLSDTALRLVGVRSGRFPAGVYQTFLWIAVAVGALATGSLLAAMVTDGGGGSTDPTPPST